MDYILDPDISDFDPDSDLESFPSSEGCMIKDWIQLKSKLHLKIPIDKK